jgi:murein DD-endopeptidase MepM/ murein hydrolase activator NlpD
VVLRRQDAKTRVILAVAVLIAGLLCTLAMSGEVRAASTSTLNGKLKDVRSELQEVRESLKEAENARKAAQGDIAALDKSIDAAEKAVTAAEDAHAAAVEKLRAIQAQLGQLNADLRTKQDELTKTQADLVTEQAVYNTRIVNVYKSGGNGNVAYLAAFFEMTSIIEVIGQMDMLSALARQDNVVVGQIKTLKARVEEQKKALEEERIRVIRLEQDQAAVTAELKAAAGERREALDELEAARAAKQKVLAAAEKQISAWEKQEDELLAESKRIEELIKKAAQQAAKGSGDLTRPVYGAVTSGFGYRIHPIFHVRKMHTGVDFDVDMGTPIKAAAAGTVIFAGWRGGYGKCTIIAHGGGIVTLYGHQSQILVSAGQQVKQGQVIGKVGSTGYSTGPHLHFEVRVNGSPVDPLKYL